MTFLLLQYFVKCCRQTSIAKALYPVGNIAKTSLSLRKEVTTSKLVSSFCDNLHFAQGSSAQLHTHLAKWVLTNHLQYCNLIGLHSSVQQYKSYRLYKRVLETRLFPQRPGIEWTISKIELIKHIESILTWIKSS